jgi:hypothetical protein
MHGGAPCSVCEAYLGRRSRRLVTAPRRQTGLFERPARGGNPGWKWKARGTKAAGPSRPEADAAGNAAPHNERGALGGGAHTGGERLPRCSATARPGTGRRAREGSPWTPPGSGRCGSQAEAEPRPPCGDPGLAHCSPTGGGVDPVNRVSRRSGTEHLQPNLLHDVSFPAPALVHLEQSQSRHHSARACCVRLSASLPARKPRMTLRLPKASRRPGSAPNCPADPGSVKRPPEGCGGLRTSSR